MTVASLSHADRQPIDVVTKILAGDLSVRMPSGSAFHAPAFVGKNGDVE